MWRRRETDTEINRRIDIVNACLKLERISLEEISLVKSKLTISTLSHGRALTPATNCDILALAMRESVSHASKKNELFLFSPSSTCLTNDADAHYRFVESSKKQEQRGSRAYEEDARLPIITSQSKYTYT